jgi:hypothetical protein
VISSFEGAIALPALWQAPSTVSSSAGWRQTRIGTLSAASIWEKGQCERRAHGSGTGLDARLSAEMLISDRKRYTEERDRARPSDWFRDMHFGSRDGGIFETVSSLPSVNVPEAMTVFAVHSFLIYSISTEFWQHKTI